MDTNPTSDLRQFCLDLGLDLFGVADVTSIRGEFALSPAMAEKFDRAVCVGAGLSRAVLEDIGDYPTRQYFHHYKTANAFLDQAAYKISRHIERLGFSAFPVAASQILDWRKQTALLSHKKVGALAGLGWLGRNNLLVNKELGSGFRLATILTDLPLEANAPVNDACGDCRACVSRCPAGAIKENPADFDHLGCFAKLKEFQKLRYVDQFICGVCCKSCTGKKR